MKSPLFAATALVAAMATFGAASASAEKTVLVDGQREVAVRYGDLELNSEAGAMTLYRRVSAAARRVCPDDASRDLNYLRAVDACREEAISRAISEVGSPKLASIHVARKGTG